MRTNVKIVLTVLAVALILGLGSCAIDSIGKDKTYISPTPTGGVKPPVTLTPTPTQAPTNVPSVSPTPTVAPTEEVSPTPTPTQAPEEDGPLTEDEAVALLKSMSADRLGLELDIEEYTMELDSWTTMIVSKDCYCINLLHPDGYLAGMYYVAVDGSAVYRLEGDETIKEITE